MLARLRCSGPAWLFAWVTAIYLPSLAIAVLGLSPDSTTDLAGLPGAVFAVADEMGPAAKLLLGALLAAGFGVARDGYGWAMATAAAAMIGTLLLVPADYSRGFGIGLTGARFDAATLPLYLAGAAAAGAVFTRSHRRCRDRRR